MRPLVVLSAFVALCYGSAIPVVPGDNSHYVEGESRYIWIPDGDDVPHLVDLHAPPEEPVSRSNSKDQYLLFTRQNPTQAQQLIHHDINSVRNSNFKAHLPIAVIVHGWNGDINSRVNSYVREALLHVGDYNVICVDWRDGAGGLYSSTVRAVPVAGENLAFFLDWLVARTGANWNNVHLIGYSLGAHVVGNTGRILGARVARITGLDPAGPQFRGNPTALNAQDARYVECIHTDGGLLGIFDPICHNNFYPNGGRNPQPGCVISNCSHSRNYQLYAASVRYNRFVGKKCANLDEAREVRCNGAELLMGNTDLFKPGFGYYGLTTGDTWPY